MVRWRRITGALAAHARVAWGPMLLLLTVFAVGAALAARALPHGDVSDVLGGAVGIVAMLLPLAATADLWRGRNGSPLNRLLLAAGWSRPGLFAAALLVRVGSTLLPAAAVFVLISPSPFSAARIALNLVIGAQLAALSALFGVWARGWRNVAAALFLVALGMPMMAPSPGLPKVSGARLPWLIADPLGWWFPPFGAAWRTVGLAAGVTVLLAAAATAFVRWSRP